MAKNLLMDDESDEESKMKKIKEEADDKLSSKTRSGRQIRSKGEMEEKAKPKAEDLMLTADKMMNTELKLLHAPVEVKHELEDIKDIENKPNTRSTNVGIVAKLLSISFYINYRARLISKCLLNIHSTYF